MVNTPRQTQRAICDRLQNAGIDSAGLESRLLLEHILALPHPTYLLPEAPLTEAQSERLEQLVNRRCAHEPLQYLLGAWEFFGLEFTVGNGVLIPRQDTEILVETVLSLRKNMAQTKLLDLCSGSGCIPAAIATHLPAVSGDVLELSEQALPYLQENLQRHAPQIRIHTGDALSPPETLRTQCYDIITCNPPYLTAEDMTVLQPEVAFEPKTALFGGTDGLDFYRQLTPLWAKSLQNGGWLLYEVGQGQAPAVQQMLEQAGLQNCRCIADLSGIERVVAGQK